MAINPTKLLPPSSGALALRSKTTDIGKKKSGGLEGQVLVIKTQVIKIEKLISRGYTLKLKEQKEEQKELEKNKRSKKEEELEEKKPPKEGKGKIPSLPKLGFFDRIKKFIGNMILAYFAVRLIDHLPKLVPFATALGNASEFLLDVGGNLLNGLVTFIDWGYKAYDATRGFLKNLGGDNFTKVFDTFNGAVGNLIETAIIAAVTLSSFGGGADVPEPKRGFDTSGRRVSTETQKRYAQRFGKNQFAKRFGKSNLINLGERGASKSVLKFVKPFTKRLPIIGALLDFGLSVALGEDPGRAAFKAIGAGLLGAVGAAVGSLVFGFGGVIGGILGSIGGDAIGGALYDVLFGGKKPQQKNQKVQKKQGGGITRGGKAQGSISRKISSKEKQRRKTRVSQKPREIEFDTPGSSVGGEEKLFGIFPNPFKKVADTFNPFKNVADAGKNLGKTDYFGPILAITSKITLGQKPTEQDYKQVGLGINLLFSEGMSKGEIVGGVAAAYADGGFVDKKSLDALMEGGDITNWVARTFKDATETNAQKTLREIRENASKKSISKEEEEKQKESGLDNLEVDPGATVTGGNADFWTLVAIARMEDSDPQGSADVAQAIYNRVASGIYGARTIKEIVLRQGQFEPTWLYPRKGKTGVPNPEWHAIKDIKTASEATGISQSDLQKTAAALRNSKYQEEARKFVGGRTDFMGGNNKPGPGDVRRKENAPNNFFGWFVGPAAKAYGAKNPGPARAPQLGDIVVMSESKTTLGSGSISNVDQFTPIAKQFGLSLTSSYRKGDPGYHGKNMARDYSNDNVGEGTPQQLSFAKHLSEKYGSSLKQLIYTPLGYGIANGKKVGLDYWGSATNSQHYHHVHVAYERGGMTKHGPHLAMIGERGREFVIDADSTAAIESTFPGFLDAINRAKYDDAINVLRNFATYEDGSQEEVIVVQNQPSQEESYQNPMVVAMGGLSGGDSYNPFEMLDRLPG